MNEHDTSYNEQELGALEEELRRLRVPHQEPQPDAAYWANFRVRVMDRVERKSAFAVLLEWIASHVLGSSLVGAGLAAAVALATFGLPGSQPSQTAVKTQITQTPALDKRVIESPSAQPQIAEVHAKASEPIQPAAAASQHRVRTAPKPTTATEDMPLLASIDASPMLQSTSEADYSVSLNELSDDELEFVYDGLRSLDSAD